MLHGVNSSTALIQGRKAGITLPVFIALSFTVSLLLLQHRPRIVQAGHQALSLLETRGSQNSFENNKIDDSEAPMQSETSRAVFGSFESQIEHEFSIFNSQLKQEMKNKASVVRTKSSNSRNISPAAETEKITVTNSHPRRKVRVRKEQNLKQENQQLIAITAAMRQQMLLTCVAKYRQAKPHRVENQQWRQEAKRSCLDSISRNVARELREEAGARRPARFLSLAKNKTKFVWEKRHYRKIGFEPVQSNYTSFVRSNIIRHSSPVRANTWDDPVPIDPSIKALKSAGVDVDTVPGLDASQRHDWGGDGKDHYNASREPPKFVYAKALHPAWAFNNHALKSQARARGGRCQAASRPVLFPSLRDGSCADLPCSHTPRF